MKRTFITVAVCLICTSSFAQQKVVRTVKNDLKYEKPNFGELRTQIKGALENPETANSAEAWFLAGDVENKAFDAECVKLRIGQNDKVNVDVMYTALDASTAFFLKADELDQLPNAKGKVKPKFRKQIKGILQANRQYYINAGSYFHEKENYAKAYDNFKFYGDIPTLPMFEGDKTMKDDLATDTNAVKIRYFAGVSASLLHEHDKAIAIYDQLKNLHFPEEVEMYQRLALEYIGKGDSASYEGALKLGAERFPAESFFLLNLINIQINNNRSDEAIEYLNKAIVADGQNAQFYDVLGLVYERKNDVPQAIVNIEKALAISPDNADALSHLGRLYYNKGVEQRGEADKINDPKKYADAMKAVEAIFRQALPYFEKAYQLNNKDSDAIFALRNIYYALKDNANYEKWDKIYSEK
ncbi:TPR-domain containing protein [Candidatus Symbiothrix dinenymphae]|nr:TPR-domain containing protein [Candidatus Symbiothrix dinenymphae]